MSKYYLHQDKRNCIGCHACEVQCKTAKRLAVGPRLCQVVPVGPETPADPAEAAAVFISCFHCETAFCVAACPTGAMQKRPKDGIVFVEKEKCIGCKACMSTCPWGAPQWDPVSRTVAKCDFCKDRLDRGLKPACVTVCLTGCLSFGEAESLPDSRRIRHATRTAAINGERHDDYTN